MIIDGCCKGALVYAIIISKVTKETIMIDKKDELKYITEKLGKLVKTKRDELGLTVAQLSKISGISTAVITDLETGKNKIPNLLSFVCLANELGLEKQFTQLIFPSKNEDENTKEGSAKQIEMFLLNYVSPSLAKTLSETIYMMGTVEKMRNKLSDKDYSIPLEDLLSRCNQINTCLK